MGYYIVNDNGHVWMHHGLKGKPHFAIDIDAGYERSRFGYANRKLAEKRAQQHGGEVVTREQLFDQMGVQDWSRGRSW